MEDFFSNLGGAYVWSTDCFGREGRACSFDRGVSIAEMVIYKDKKKKKKKCGCSFLPPPDAVGYVPRKYIM